MKKRIVVPYFTGGIKFVSPIIGLIGFYVAFAEHPVWGALLMLLALVMFTTNYVTEIDMGNKTYNDYLSLLGMKLNQDKAKFNELHHVVITKGNYSQKVITRVQSRQIDWSDYTATLIHDNDGELVLLTRTSKRELLVALKAFTDFMKLDVQDCTLHDPYWIDMDKVGKEE